MGILAGTTKVSTRFKTPQTCSIKHTNQHSTQEQGPKAGTSLVKGKTQILDFHRTTEVDLDSSNLTLCSGHNTLDNSNETKHSHRTKCKKLSQMHNQL